LIVATAGHVDHGKTSLIKQLTGVDTDRTTEEQRRGLSINLGFAYLGVNEQHRIGFVDVPGHQRFLNTMIAGISGVDLVMLVVAADDGPMPQTLEHLDILRTLGVQRFLLVISKIDRVDEQRVAVVRQQSLALLPDNTPCFAVSCINGQGISELSACLQDMTEEFPPRPAQGYFRMSLDRAFHLKGAGLVVTGTVGSGYIEEGDELILQPQQQRVKVRTIHAQDKRASRAQAGQRCALNLTGDVDKDDIARGDWLSHPQAGAACSRFDARLQMLVNSPVALKHLSLVKLYLGAKRIDARLFLIERSADSSALRAGEQALVQLIVDGRVLCCRGDRFLLRDYGETLTLAGGVVIDPQAPQFGKAHAARLQHLAAMELATPLQALTALVAAQQLVSLGAFAASWNLTAEEASQVLAAPALKEVRRTEADGDTLLASTQLWLGYRSRLLEFVRLWHETHPAEIGFAPSVLAKNMDSEAPAELVQALLLELLKDQSLRLESGVLQMPGHTPALDTGVQQDWLRVEQLLRQCGVQVPKVSQLAEQLNVPLKQLEALLSQAAKQGRLQRITASRYALPSTLNDFASVVTKLVTEQGSVSARDFRDAAGCGRNLAIEVLEYFDAKHFTRRQGDTRIIIDAGLSSRPFNE
jgi:selenocysteine-specific elongation factor